MTGFVIEVRGVNYLGGFGYAGRACAFAGLKPGTLYPTESTAQWALAALTRVSTIGFVVHEFRAYAENRKSRPQDVCN